MPRTCTVCNAAEYLLQIDARLRAGESQTAIAKEFGFSPDAVQRHYARHVRQDKNTGGELDAASIFHEIAERAGEIARSATLTGDLRGAIDALGRQAAAAESYSRIAEAQKAVANAPEPVWKNGELNPDALQSSMTIGDFDKLIEKVTTETHPHLDFAKSCPFCGQLGMPRTISESLEPQ